MEQFLKNNLTYQGRLNRQAFIIRYILASLVKGIPSFLLILFVSFYSDWIGRELMDIFILVQILFVLVIFLFQLMLCIRRFHDIDIGGRLTTYVFLFTSLPSIISAIIPLHLLPEGLKDLYFVIYAMSVLVNVFFHIILFFRRGNDCDNKYGQNPLEKNSEEFNFKSFLKEQCSFKGRLNRKAYIIKSVQVYLVSFVIAVITIGFFDQKLWERALMQYSSIEFIIYFTIMVAVGLVFLLTIIFMVIVNIAINVERLHDINLPGKILFIYFVVNQLLVRFYFTDNIIYSVLTMLFYLILFLKRGTVGENKYGQDRLQKAIETS